MPSHRKQLMIRILHPAAVVALCALTACGLPSLPSELPGLRDLEIRGTTLLMPGSNGRLTAWLPDDRGSREVQATWTAEGDAISITSDGRIVAQRPGGAIVRADYEHRTGSKTVHVVDSIAGVWRGSITVLDCWDGVGTSPSPCQGRRGLTAPLVLDVTQSATAEHFNLQATAAIFTPPATGTLTGAVDSNGVVYLAGRVERPGDSLGGLVNLRWLLGNGELVPSLISGLTENRFDLELSVRYGSSTTLFHEVWELHPLVR